MHAIIETGGKQFRVAPGDVIRVPKLAAEVGAEIALGRVVALFQDSGELLTGDKAGGARVWCSNSSARSSTSARRATGSITRRFVSATSLRNRIEAVGEIRSWRIKKV